MKKRIFSGVLSIVLCLSLVVGGTFALFTSESNTNIAITSGTVDVKAEVTLDELYSPTLNLDGTVFDPTDIAEDTFANGGTVTVNGSEIKINNMTPGDKATFKVTITNNSNVAFMQRLTFGCTDADKAFFNELLIGIKDENDAEYTYYADFATAWDKGTPIAEGEAAEVTTKYITIEMPGFVGNKWQNKTANLTLNLKAVQGNAVVTDAKVEKVITVVDAAGVEAAVNGAKDGDVIFLNERADAVNVAFDDAKEVTLRGYKIGALNVNAPNGTLHVYNNLGTVNCEYVAQHSLYVYGDIDSIIINSGRVVVENTSYVKVVRISPVANAKVTLSIPETIVADKVLVGRVDSVIIDGLDAEDNVEIRISPEIDDAIISGKEQEGVEVVETTGSADSFVADDNAKIIYVGDEAGLREFSDRVNAGDNYAGWTVKLTADIDLENRPWTPIGYAVVENNKYVWEKSPCFAGSFDGQGHTISNLYVDEPNTNIRGFFGYAKLVSVKNLNFHNAYVTGLRRSAVLIGQNDGSAVIENVHLTGDIKVEVFRNEAGTLVGRGGISSVSNVTVNATRAVILNALRPAILTGNM